MPRRIAGPRALADHPRKFSELAPEDQTQNKPDSQRSKYRLRWIFAHILLRVVLECAGAIPRIPPCLFCFAAILSPDGACRRFQVFSRPARMLLTALQLVPRIRPSRGFLF